MSTEARSHRCDERCVCEIHDKPFIYWPAGDDHACQDPDCKYAHGVDDVRRAEMEGWRPGSVTPL